MKNVKKVIAVSAAVFAIVIASSVLFERPTHATENQINACAWPKFICPDGRGCCVVAAPVR